MREDQICGTSNPTPHQVLLDTRFELPFGMFVNCESTLVSLRLSAGPGSDGSDFHQRTTLNDFLEATSGIASLCLISYEMDKEVENDLSSGVVCTRM